MSTAPQVPGQLKTYFWMVHYDKSPAPQDAAGDALKPIPAGRKRNVFVVHRNVYGSQVVGYNMAREGENEIAPDTATFRGPADLRNRVIGFYASAEEANAHLTEQIWTDLQEKCGAIYAELHSMRLDVAQETPGVVRLVA